MAIALAHRQATSSKLVEFDVGILRYLRVCGCCTGGERDGRTKQEWGGFLAKRTTTRTYMSLVIKLYLLSLDIYIIQLFSLDIISTIIHFGLAALTYIFSIIFHKSRSALLVLLLHPLVPDR